MNAFLPIILVGLGFASALGMVAYILNVRARRSEASAKPAGVYEPRFTTLKAAADT